MKNQGEILKKQEQLAVAEYYKQRRKASVPTQQTTPIYMMGQGLGNNLGLDGPQYTVWKTPAQIEIEEQEKVKENEKKRVEAKLKAARTRIYNKTKKAILAAKMERGELLSGQRVFLVKWVKENWEEIARIKGGMPKGVDIAKTQFGHLIIVPVVEKDQNESAKFRPRKDPYGRSFWVQAETKDRVSSIFGSIEWDRPLTMEEARQFGISFQEVSDE